MYETSERENRYMVQRPVMETAERDQYSTVCEPQTTYTTRYADQGGWQEYQVAKPGPVYNQPVCVPGGCSTDPCTGLTHVYRPRPPVTNKCKRPRRWKCNRVWKPNIVAEQIPQTTYVQKVVVQKVPVQVCRYVNEEVVQKVPVTVCRMVQEEQVRKVPVTVCRQVVEHVENKVPVQVCKMVPEEQVRKVPVTTCRMVNEEHVEQVPVQVCKMVAVRGNGPRAAIGREAHAGHLHLPRAAHRGDARAGRSVHGSASGPVTTDGADVRFRRRYHVDARPRPAMHSGAGARVRSTPSDIDVWRRCTAGQRSSKTAKSSLAAPSRRRRSEPDDAATAGEAANGWIDSPSRIQRRE